MLTRCSLCESDCSADEIDHVEMGPDAAIPLCIRCLAEMHEVSDGRRDALVEAVEAAMADMEWPMGGELPWDQHCDIALMVAAL